MRSLCGALAAAVALTGVAAVASGAPPAEVRRSVAEVVSSIAVEVPPAAAPASVVEPTAGSVPNPPMAPVAEPAAEPGATTPEWDACRPVTVVVNDRLAPLGARTELWEALAELAAATGMTFHDSGTTDAVPTSAWLRVPDDDPTLVVTWAPRALTDVIVPGAAATGGWYAHDGRRITKGFVVVDATPGVPTVSGALLGTLLLHELGHVAGLDHVDDAGQVMFPTVSAASPEHYTAADLAALAVRTSPCR